MPHPFVSFLCGAIERCPPLNGQRTIRNDRTNAYRRNIVLHRKRRIAAEPVGIGTLDVGVGEQNLPDDVSRVGDAAHGPDLISSLAVFNDGLALDARPSVVIERSDHRPHFIGRMIEHDAVVGFCHCSKPPLPSTRGCPTRRISSEAQRSVSCGSILSQSRSGGRPAWRNCAEPRPGERAPRPLRTRPGGACGETVDPTDYLTKVREWMRRVRSFNRAVSQRIGALKDHFLDRDRPLGEARLLYEIGLAGAEVRDLRARLELDSGYVSRLLRSLERQQLVRAQP